MRAHSELWAEWAQGKGGEQTEGRKGRACLGLSYFVKIKYLVSEWNVGTEFRSSAPQGSALGGQWDIVLEDERTPAFVLIPLAE